MARSYMRVKYHAIYPQARDGDPGGAVRYPNRTVSSSQRATSIS